MRLFSRFGLSLHFLKLLEHLHFFNIHNPSSTSDPRLFFLLGLS